MSKVIKVLVYQGKTRMEKQYSAENIDHMQDLKMTLGKDFVESVRNDKEFDNTKDVIFVAYGSNDFGIEIRYTFSFNLVYSVKEDILNKMRGCVLKVRNSVEER